MTHPNTIAGQYIRGDLVAFITSYIADTGYSPTVREMAAALGLSISNTHRHVDRAIDAGVLQRAGGAAARTIRPT